MAARCASCSYPLSVSDSVSCCECKSYFHIDCAQLVGFPFYELSSDPIRNTFHCQTCRILPLPRQSDSFSDSDSDECAMPSRQLDYHLEGQPDFAKEMNEVKGTVQDLSELCKDMFREISELKSINLTLRCCVENLRHDGEQRDGIISDLKRRIEALEGKGNVNVFEPIDTTGVFVDRSIEKEEDAERYLTPDPEYSRLKEVEFLDEERSQKEGILPINDEQNLIQHNLECETSGRENIIDRNILQSLVPFETAIEIPYTETSELDEEKIHENNEERVNFAEEETISTTAGEDNSGAGAIISVKDWDWRGNEAVQLKEVTNDSSAEEEEEEEEIETTDVEDTEAQGWEILDEDVKAELITKHYEEEESETARSIEEAKEEVEDRRVTWADEVDKYDKDEENAESNEVEEPVLKSDPENVTESFEPRIESRSIYKGEETEETNEDATEQADRTSLKDEEAVEKSQLKEDVEIVEGGAEVEGRVDSSEGSRLEGEPRLEGESTAEGAVPEGEREGGQSPSQGEVQPSELSEGSGPPPPPQPEHTPDDLWDYLKETVTGEHPATVEEFVQKLIGTLEHVPEEYLKPVIDLNIKRATSPSVTDGEHLEGKEGDQQLEGEVHKTEDTGSAEAHPQESGEAALGGEDRPTSLPGGDSSVSGGGGVPSEEPAALNEVSTNLPEDPSESAEGYSTLEAAS